MSSDISDVLPRFLCRDLCRPSLPFCCGSYDVADSCCCNVRITCYRSVSTHIEGPEIEMTREGH